MSKRKKSKQAEARAAQQLRVTDVCVLCGSSIAALRRHRLLARMLPCGCERCCTTCALKWYALGNPTCPWCRGSALQIARVVGKHAVEIVHETSETELGQLAAASRYEWHRRAAEEAAAHARERARQERRAAKERGERDAAVRDARTSADMETALRALAAARGTSEVQALRDLLRAVAQLADVGWRPRKNDPLRLAAASLLNTKDIRSLGGEWSGVSEVMRSGGAAACIALRARVNEIHAGGEPLFYGSERI